MKLNKADRKAIENQVARLDELRGDGEGIIAELDTIVDDLRGRFEERSDRWQESEAGEEMSHYIDALKSLSEDIDCAFANLDIPELP